MKMNRSLPYFNALVKAPSSKRMTILQSFPSFVIDDLLEVIVNIVRGNVNITKAKKLVLQKHKRSLLSLVNSKNRRLMRKIMYKQHGGFLGALIPIVLSAISAISSLRS